MNYKEKYENALEKAREYNNVYKDHTMMSYAKGALEDIFPELKESENEIIRKEIINYFKCQSKEEPSRKDIHNKWIAWLEKQGDYNKLVEEIKKRKELLSKEKEKAKSANDRVSLGGRIAMLEEILVFANEKQGDTNETINRDKFAQDVLRGAAINLIVWIDYNAAEGNMCLSNMECEDIEDALVSGNWDKIYAYIKKKLEKQGEQKPMPIFKVGDTIIAKDGTYEKEPFHIDRIEDDCYWNGENTILVCNQDDFEIFKQNSADKVEPKFHEGEWIFIEEVKGYKNGPFQIKTVDSFGYSFDEYHTIPFMYEEILSKWTIQDTKDGDVIFYDNGWTCIFKNIHGIWYSSYCFITADGEFHTGYEQHDVDAKLNGNANPATKEQRDLLFQKMKEAGYEWDAEKKELRKIIDEKQIKKNLQDNSFRRMFEQKLVEWSEEDKKMLEELLNYCDTSIQYNGIESPRSIKWKKRKEWLISIKDKVQPQSQWKPSDEQLNNILDVLSFDNCTLKRRELLESLYEQLKKL